MSFSIYTNQNGDIQLPNLTISSDLRFPTNNVRIGQGAGNNSQGNLSIAIGGFSGNLNQGNESIAIGADAGNYGQNNQAIAIGIQAGETLQNTKAISLGYRAGRNNQGQFGIAIGSRAGEVNQQDGCIAIGDRAGNVNQGVDSIALGNGAGTLNQEDNTTIINSTGVALNGIAGINNALYVAPIRNFIGESTLRYNNTTKEITYSNNPFGELINTASIPITQNIATVMHYNSIEIALFVGIDALNPSRIEINETGVYKIGTSIQFTKSGGGVVEVDIWFRKNGNDIPNSASAVEITGGANARNFSYVEIMEQFNVNDFIEVVCGTTNAGISALGDVALVAPPFNRPAIPSIITTVYKISE